jgi:hypothetical protein
MFAPHRTYVTKRVPAQMPRGAFTPGVNVSGIRFIVYQSYEKEFMKELTPVSCNEKIHMKNMCGSCLNLSRT